MSGGHFDYNQYRIDDVADGIDRLIESHGKERPNDFGDALPPLPPEILNKFREASHTLKRAREMVHEIDWLVSGDTGNETFLKRWETDIRPPWESSQCSEDSN